MIARADVHAHVTLADGRAFTLAIARFDGMSWASLVDVDRKRCTTLAVGRAPMDRPRNPLVRRALDEVLAAGRLPYPDRIGEPIAGLRVRFPDDNIACELALEGGRVAGWIELDGVRHAAAGVGTTVEGLEGGAVIVLDDGTVICARSDELVPLRTWTSRYTFHDFPVAWRYRDLEIRAVFDDQELVTMTAGAPVWRGRCDVRGGVAFVEQAAIHAPASMTDLFAAIPRETKRAIGEELPLPVTIESMRKLLGGELAPYVRDLDPAEIERVLIRPIREVVDRMGKAWRSYAAVMCYLALRGDRHRRDAIDGLLSLTEVIHAGSLIVDDVEDGSPTRRGGPACHVAHGVPIAINAGTFCYFVWQSWIARLGLDPAARLEIYERYFELMRLAHLGQALDIQGFTPGDDLERLARQIRAVYVFKTGAPASIFARIGAIVAGGDGDAVRAIGELFEALGLAFQIADDVHNLKGFAGDPKHAEDLTQGKVTMPVLAAMRVLEPPNRDDLWARIRRCAGQPELVPGIIDDLERCGAFAACRDEARELIESAWARVSPLLEDSIPKVMLRAFCFYVVESLG